MAPTPTSPQRVAEAQTGPAVRIPSGPATSQCEPPVSFAFLSHATLKAGGWMRWQEPKPLRPHERWAFRVGPSLERISESSDVVALPNDPHHGKYEGNVWPCGSSDRPAVHDCVRPERG